MSWGQLPLTITSGTNNVSLGLSVRVASGSGPDSLTGGPAGSGTQVGSTQWVQTTIADFTPGTTTNTELFVPGMSNYLGSIGSTGTGNGQFGSEIIQMAFGQNGKVYVADRTNNRVQVFDSSFNFLQGWGNGTTWTGAAPAPAAGTANGYFSQSGGLAIDAQGNVYVSDISNQRVQKFDSNGNFQMGWGNGTTWTGAAPAPSSGGSNGYFNAPTFVQVDPDNNVWVMEWANHRIQKFSPNGVFLMGIGSGTSWTAGTSAPAVASGSTPLAFWNPGNFVFDRQGNLYVADQHNSRIQKISPTGTFLSQWGSVGSADGQFPSEVFGLGMDPFGRLWASSGTSNNWVQIFTQGGQYVARVTGPTASQLKSMDAVAVDGSGNLYVTDANSNMISKFQGASPTDANGGVRLAGYRSPGPCNFVTSGTYVSSVLDAQSTVAWGSIYWAVSNLPTGTGVAVGVATSSDAVNWGATQSVAASSVAGNNVASLSATSFNSRFLRYQLTLTSINAATTSEVQEVGVIY